SAADDDHPLWNRRQFESASGIHDTPAVDLDAGQGRYGRTGGDDDLTRTDQTIADAHGVAVLKLRVTLEPLDLVLAKQLSDPARQALDRVQTRSVHGVDIELDRARLDTDRSQASAVGLIESFG